MGRSQESMRQQSADSAIAARKLWQVDPDGFLPLTNPNGIPDGRKERLT